MAHMAGRFAGILQVSVAAEQADALAAALTGLDQQGLKVMLEKRTEAAPPAPAPGTLIRVEVVGPDRGGVIREVSSVLADKQLNVERLTTECEAAPMAGGKVLKVEVDVRLSGDTTAGEVGELIEQRVPDFLVDVSRLGEPSSSN